MQQVTFIEEIEEEGNSFHIYLSPNKSKNGIWFLDNGCSNHITGHEKAFSYNLDELVKLQVQLGDGKAENNEGK